MTQLDVLINSEPIYSFLLGKNVNPAEGVKGFLLGFSALLKQK